MSEYIASISYGKDSLAMLEAIRLLGWPLDRIVTADVWATDTIPADLPPMVEFKAKADEIIKRRWGIKVEHVFAKREGRKWTFEDGFYLVKTSRSYRCGEITGWPWQRGAWCNGSLKMPPLERFERGNNIVYIGIAADEPKRFHNLSERKKSPLVEAGWSEFVCRTWCENNDLLSPIYTSATRGGGVGFATIRA